MKYQKQYIHHFDRGFPVWRSDKWQQAWQRMRPSPCRQADDAEAEAPEAPQRMVLFQRSGLLPEDLGAALEQWTKAGVYSHDSYHISIHVHILSWNDWSHTFQLYLCEYPYPTNYFFQLFIPPTMSCDTCLLFTMIAVMSGESHPDPLCEPQAIRDTMPPSFSPEDWVDLSTFLACMHCNVHIYRIYIAPLLKCLLSWTTRSGVDMLLSRTKCGYLSSWSREDFFPLLN